MVFEAGGVGSGSHCPMWLNEVDHTRCGIASLVGFASSNVDSSCFKHGLGDNGIKCSRPANLFAIDSVADHQRE